MTDYPQYPSGPTPPGGYAAAQPARGPRPAPVSLAVKLIWVGIALSVVSAIVTVAVLDDLVDAALDQPGAQGLPAATIRASAVGGVVIGLVIGAGLNTLLAIFIGRGANWARITYTVLAALGIVFGLIGMASGSAGPAVLTVISLVSLLIAAAVLVLLWRKESGAWFSTPRFPVA